jgi:hypothetical protein
MPAETRLVTRLSCVHSDSMGNSSGTREIVSSVNGGSMRSGGGGQCLSNRGKVAGL